jgi:hypothetical protein
MAGNKEARAGESVLARWSRRKLEADEGDVKTAPDQAPADAVTMPAAEAEAKPLTDADMPDIETLTEASDYSAFMSAEVSDGLRNLALRKLWRAPSFNIRDGLDDYDDDYTSFAELGDIVTCDMKHQVEMREQKRREAQEQEKAAVEAADSENATAGEGEAADANDPPAPVAAAGADDVALKSISKADVDNE